MSNTFIRISGNTVQRIEENVSREISLPEFLASIESNVPIESGMLPRNCIFFAQRSGVFVYVIEISAMMINVQTRGRGDHPTTNQYRLSIPFTQFFLSGNPQTGALGAIYLSATKRPLRSMTESTFLSPYPNIFGGGQDHVCTGEISIPQNIPIDAKINVLTNEFFTAAFNSDLQPATPNGWQWRGVEDYFSRWQEETIKNRCWMISEDARLQNNPRTPQQMIDRCFAEHEGR